MSFETQEWLIRNLRIGFTDERGPAWWAAEDHMADGSHFPGAVPEEEVRRLLDVMLVSGPVSTMYTTPDGERVPLVDKSRQAIIRVNGDDSEILGIFKDGYQIHGYNEWINDAMTDIADSKLETAAVGLLRKGGVAFHQVKLPDVFEVKGFGFRPYFTGGTSCDGTLASLWFTGIDAAVCDNTFEMARAGASTRVSYKHTRNSPSRLIEAKDRLGLTLKAGEAFAELATDLMEVDVSEKDFQLWLDEMVPLPEKKPTKGGGNGIGYTKAENKRNELEDLTRDPKVAPWWGTAFGVLQLDNTNRTWNRTVKGADGGRMERNLLNDLTGSTADDDKKALDALSKVLGRTLVMA